MFGIKMVRFGSPDLRTCALGVKRVQRSVSPWSRDRPRPKKAENCRKTKNSVKKLEKLSKSIRLRSPRLSSSAPGVEKYDSRAIFLVPGPGKLKTSRVWMIWAVGGGGPRNLFGHRKRVRERSLKNATKTCSFPLPTKTR